ncbi:MAG: HEAT repeat domain-containing protein [Terriglobales bacterium]
MQTSSVQVTGAASPANPRHGLSARNRMLFFLTAWLIVLMPMLFWWNTWFGRTLSDKQLNKYLHDDAHPRHIQHALVQLGERMARRDRNIVQWYPAIAQLGTYRVEEIRNTAAWVMGQDTSSPEFHQTLLNMLNDNSPAVRGNAALALVRFGDAAGRPHIVALLQPATVVAPESGKLADAALPGTLIHQGGVLAKLHAEDQTITVRSPITGRLRSLSASKGQAVNAGSEIAVVDPGTEQVWEALRALVVVGQPDDLPAISRYQRELPGIPDHVRRQAAETERAIRQRNQ